jgi:amino-acid N-acetyltransferase
MREATPADLEPIRRLLTGCGLPDAGLEATQFFLLDGEDGPLGVVGLEPHGQTVLVRSLAVHPDAQGAGLGSALLDHALAQAARRGFLRAAALTTTVSAWLAREGWQRVERSQLPAELEGSAELQGACPASAACFVRNLRPAAAAAP